MMKTSITASFQLFLIVFNAPLMISNDSIFSPDLSLASIKDKKILKGGKKKGFLSIHLSPKQKALFKKKKLLF